MILEFYDQSQINVKGIFGGPKLIGNIIRDTLRIEVDPSTITFDELRNKFRNSFNLSLLYTYSETPTDTEETAINKNLIGEGYKIFVSISEEERVVPHMPGLLAPEEKETIYVVNIAQQTWDEHVADPDRLDPIRGEQDANI